MSDLDDVKGPQTVLGPLEVDAFAFRFGFGGGHDAVSIRVRGRRPVDVGQFVNRNTVRCMPRDPVQQLIASGLKRLHVHRFFVSHAVTRDVNFDVLG